MKPIQRVSRRDFVKTSAILSSGAALASGLNISRSAYAGTSDVLKVAVIGCGERGRGAVGNCLTACQNVKLIAVADAFSNAAQYAVNLFKKQFPEKTDVPPERVFVGLDAYEKAIACGADIVILTTPPGFRPLHYAAAVKAGKHVFMEKPCCVDAPGFRSLMESNKVADEKNLKVVVGLQRHYSPNYIKQIRDIHDGKLGNLILMRAYWNGGNIWFRERNPKQTEMEYQIHNWYHFVWLSGDNICEQHVHNIDVCCWAKNDYPVEAVGMGGCLRRYVGRDPKKGMGQIFDEHSVEFVFKDGSRMISQCRQLDGTWGTVAEFAHGTKGSIELRGGGNDPYEAEHVALVDAIRTDKKHNDGWHGAKSSFTAVLGRMATYSGQCIRWSDAVEKGRSELPEKLAFDANPRAMPDANGCYPIPVPGLFNPFC
jgi:myo-inositol 2-dehydrogenase / D-chiro-inositol 1-dehydrogenase